MTIENIVNIVGGKLLNEPKVKKVESATIYPSKVENGDLFFALDKESAKKAIENGAFAIVFDFDLEITDPEIAYIKVDSIKSATINFLRYINLQKESKIYLFEDVEISLLKMIVSRRTNIYTIISNNWQKSFETLLNSDYEIYITSSKELASAISPNYCLQESMASGYIISDSLLKTTFKIDKFIYQSVSMPPFLFDRLRRVVKFCQEHQTEYDINRLKYPKEFKPIYIQNDLTPAPFGTTDRVLIFSNSLNIIQEALEYLKKEGKWIKSIVLTPPKTKLENLNKPIWYKDLFDAKELLKKEYYNYAFCYNINPEDILNKEDIDYSLFN